MSAVGIPALQGGEDVNSIRKENCSMKTKLEELLERPFDAYMRGCWQHAFDKAGTDPIAMYLYEMAVKEPAAIEAQWAKRYWFHKNGAYEDGQT